ncbi:hypothetical protein H3146_10585 [Streptomyces sp. OF3]|uniref:Uncharacterized protein n=1 Tax=Streptomyces alkaliterrae TaxID=2213162 RepID=A0A7W3WZ90_9ACTN|nr:hypothetical protein [Streptomyces alkaliterrae]MBB1253809.1 hypothetical protein [Streptomyces alkaliterrae]MBB1261035.1 hypothetical protein [Streptomyces alkaliterrae]
MAALWLAGRRLLETLDNADEAHLLRHHVQDAMWEIDWRGSTAGAWTYPLEND